MSAIGKTAAVAITVVAVILVVATPYFTGVLGSTGNGTLDLKVHDAPCTDCTHVWVTFSSVAIHESNSSNANGSWVTTPTSGTLDLMALNGSAMAKTIGLLSLKAGHYQQVRLTVQNVTVELVGGMIVQATVHGPTANLDQSFTIGAGATTTLNIDVDLASSVHVFEVGGQATATFTPNIGSVIVTGG